jgi:hypothetical protein
MLGNSLSEYVAFQKPILILIAAYPCRSSIHPRRASVCWGCRCRPTARTSATLLNISWSRRAIGFPIIGWLLGSLVLLATRKSARPASA